MRRIALIAIPLAILAALIVWRINQHRAEGAEQEQSRQSRTRSAPLVALAPAAVRDVVSVFEAVGTVESPFRVELAPRVSGRVVFLQAREGDTVTQGQVLARLDRSQIEADVRQQQARLAEEQSRLAQALTNQNPSQVSVSTQVEQQEAAVASARADYAQSRQAETAEVSAAQASVTDMQGKVEQAAAAMTSAQAAIRSAEASLANARARRSRAEELLRKGFISVQEADDARTQVSVQEGAVEVARAQLGVASAQRSSAVAQKEAAERQAEIVKGRAAADVAASRARVQQAEAGLRYARANRVQPTAYRQSIAALRSSVDAARASLRGAQAQLAYADVVSPLTGVVTARHLDPGAMAGPSQPVLTVQSVRQVWVTVSVPETVNRHVRVGQAVPVTLDARPDRPLRGTVTLADPAADPASRQFTIRVALSNPDGAIRPGMSARATFELDRVRGAVVVPREAVHVAEGETPYVTVVDAENVAHRREVVAGASDVKGIAIASGLQAGEKVITMSAFPVRDGQTVRTGGGREPGARGTGAPGAQGAGGGQRR